MEQSIYIFILDTWYICKKLKVAPIVFGCDTMKLFEERVHI